MTPTEFTALFGAFLVADERLFCCVQFSREPRNRVGLFQLWRLPSGWCSTFSHSVCKRCTACVFHTWSPLVPHRSLRKSAVALAVLLSLDFRNVMGESTRADEQKIYIHPAGQPDTFPSIHITVDPCSIDTNSSRQTQNNPIQSYNAIARR